MPKKRTASQLADQPQDAVALRTDRQTAQEILRMSQTTHFNPQQMLRWLTWLGRKSMGRKITIQEGNKTLTISLEEFEKMTDKLDLK